MEFAFHILNIEHTLGGRVDISYSIFELYNISNIHNMQANIEPNDGAQSFTLMNSFWFILASLLGQGVDLLPRSFFLLILLISHPPPMMINFVRKCGEDD